MSDQNIQAAAVTVKGAGQMLGGLSHTSVYRLIRGGELCSFQAGHRRFVSVEAIYDYIARAEQKARAKHISAA